jgi:hypothetical protein
MAGVDFPSSGTVEANNGQLIQVWRGAPNA